MTQGLDDGNLEVEPPKQSPRVARLWKNRPIFRRHGKSPGVKESRQLSSSATSGKPSTIRQLFPLVFFLSILAGAAVGFLILNLADSDTAASRMFVNTSQFDEWQAMVCGAFGVAVAVAYMTWPSFFRMARVANRPSLVSAVLVYFLMAILIVVIPFITTGGGSSFDLSHFYVRITILTVLLLLAGAGSFCGLILIWNEQYLDMSNVRSKGGETIRAILSTRSNIQRFFVGAALLITCGVVIVGGLRTVLDTVTADYYTLPNTIEIKHH